MSIIYKNILIFSLLFFCSLIFSQDKLGTIYIIFDINKGDRKIERSDKITFILSQNDSVKMKSQHMLIFSFESRYKKKAVCFSDAKNKLLSGIEAIKKVNYYLEKRALECERINKDKKHCSIIRNPAAYYYNNYFKKIYLYERIDNKKGFLYEVKWVWGIE